MNVIAIVQARMNSSRLPGKVLKPINNRPMLELLLERLSRAQRINSIIVATSHGQSDDDIAKFCAANHITCVRGSLNDVLARFNTVMKAYPSQHVVRITADCPLLDPELIDHVIAEHLAHHADYTSNCLSPTFPDGLDVEVIRSEVLLRAHLNAKTSLEREHVTPYVYSNPELFKIHVVKNDTDLSELRWTVDNPEDFALIETIYHQLYNNDPLFTFMDVLKLVNDNPELKHLNKHIKRNEGFKQSDELVLSKCNTLLDRASNVIPTGSQTFSKSKYAFPEGAAPLYLKSGKGCIVTDYDGNEYIDFVNGLLSISLGYCDPDVDAAVKNQIDLGTIFSLPTEIETVVAEKLCALIPSADMVRFGKNGSDATTAAIRLARAYTGKDDVAVCGYHGWHDWYIGSTTRKLGIPDAVCELTHKFNYNDIASLEQVFAQHKLAAVIMEPMNVAYPEPGFLEQVRQLCDQHNTLLIFDETITGFRFHLNGAQTLFNVTPDLSTFGKGMANGWPLSAVVGKRRIMMLMEEIFFSGTFAGDAVALTAASTVIDKMQRDNVLDHIAEQGEYLISQLNNLIVQFNCEHWLKVLGHPSWSFITISDRPNATSFEIKTLLIQEMAKRGILVSASHNLSYAHQREHIDRLLKAYEEVLPLINLAIEDNTLLSKITGKILQPVFKVR
ncbi:aminotransferase class III-fold pyridoxal phosphate-dependent enzyme [Pseudoalteromonas fenneropenaei]|uniref:Aminotransferase class III-fold pyridoxal phosphate-dependent enzyme n=1 Tax=Pseudoalteromonas fenneropenaei TaxID=1737459 RepID=A0ABV7CGY9_9GAMM